jgi:hypothetical protein
VKGNIRRQVKHPLRRRLDEGLQDNANHGSSYANWFWNAPERTGARDYEGDAVVTVMLTPLLEPETSPLPSVVVTDTV